MGIDTGNPKVQKTLVALLLLGGLGYAYFTYVFTPRRERTVQIEQELTRARSSLAAAQAVVQAADTLLLLSELEKRTAELALVEALLPVEENLPGLLKEISLLGDREGVEFALFQPAATVQHELYQERPYKVTLRGGYHQTAAFLSEVSGLPQIVKPAGMKMVRDTRADKTPGETVTAELTLTTYLLVPAPPPEKVKKEVRGGKEKK
jgi:type IV pilus assembly protein PilO